jgi:hypothetical protein
MSELKLRPPVASTLAPVLPLAYYAQGKKSCPPVFLGGHENAKVKTRTLEVAECSTRLDKKEKPRWAA